MTDTVVLQFDDLKSDAVSWRPMGKRSSPLAPRGSGSLEQAAEQLKGWRLLTIVSSSEIQLTKVEIPSKNRQRLIQAIPFTLENDLTEEIDELHFAHDTQSSDNTCVAIVSRARLSAWLGRLKQLELQPLGMFSGVLCLPLMTGNWSIYLEKDLSLVRTDVDFGFTVDTENLPVLLTKAITEAAVQPKLLDVFIDSNTHEDYAISLLKDLDISHHLIPFTGVKTELLAENLDEKHSLNILQGEYKQIDNKSLQWRRWLPAAALFSFLFGLSIATTFLDYVNYKQQSISLSAEINQVFRDAFPEIKRIVDPKVQMEQQLKLLKKGGAVGHADFLSLMKHPATTLQQSSDTSIESISYRDGQLDLKLILKDLQSLDDIKKAIESQKLSVEIRSANASGNRVTSHLRIRQGGT